MGDRVIREGFTKGKDFTYPKKQLPLTLFLTQIPGIFEAVKDEGGKIVSFQGTTVTLLEWFAQQANFT